MHRHINYNSNNYAFAANPASVVATSSSSSSSSGHTTIQQPSPVQPDETLRPLYDSALDVVWVPFELNNVNPLELALDFEHLPGGPTLRDWQTQRSWVHGISNHDPEPAVHPPMANPVADTSLEQMQGIVQYSTINATPAISPTIIPPPSPSVTMKSVSLTENNTSNEQISRQISAIQVHECPHARDFGCRAILHGTQDLQRHIKAHAKLEHCLIKMSDVGKIWEEVA